MDVQTSRQLTQAITLLTKELGLIRKTLLTKVNLSNAEGEDQEPQGLAKKLLNQSIRDKMYGPILGGGIPGDPLSNLEDLI